MKNNNIKLTLGICIPVWNRGDLFKICFTSLLRQLKDVDATIWIYDNGSDIKTREIVEGVKSSKHRIIKTFFPQNMGIPYVANLFAKAVQENCDLVNYTSPQYVMIMDADAYFKKSVWDLVELCRKHYGIGLISGHDSIEHKAIKEKRLKLKGKNVLIKQKKNERMLTMLMKREEFIRCYPFPHYRNRDVDWELAQWNPNSMKKRNRGIFVACDYVLHLGLGVSTWQKDRAINNHSAQEIKEVKQILNRNDKKN